jgi:hypothetical protein
LASLPSVLDVERRFESLEIFLDQATCLAESWRVASRRRSRPRQASALKRLYSAVELVSERRRTLRQTPQQGCHSPGIETGSLQELNRPDVGLLLRRGVIVLYQGADLVVSAPSSSRAAEVPFENMSHLMRKHGRELGLVPHEGHQPVGQDDIPVPCREGAGRKIPRDIESPSLAPSTVQALTEALR